MKQLFTYNNDKNVINIYLVSYKQFFNIALYCINKNQILYKL